MSRPLRENLEIHAGDDGDWIRCRRCRHTHCRADQDWRAFCKVRLLPPTQAGELMADLTGHYLLRQIYCPSCGALLDTDLVEEEENDARRT
jgi:acetone carboxylase gamma subunit